ncbi:MAG: hypothetical protein UV96_C0040G0006 [Parcubacteria group bacterium GW2011_GWF2_43_38]|nr:MAG: hypothetical protein UV96_C0040G0006 [Parcubacteria group bacterium GW2011_GWF2_43_38]
MAAENELIQVASGISAETLKSIGAGFTIAIGGMFPALAIGRLAAKAMELRPKYKQP